MTRALVTLFFCGDLMTGRGIDQILPAQSPPELFDLREGRSECMWRSPRSGMAPFPSNVDYRYIWGEALEILDDQTCCTDRQSGNKHHAK